MRASLKSEKPFAIGLPALVWQALFFYLPLAFVFVSSFIRLSNEGRFQGFTLSHIATFLNLIYFKVIGASLLLALSNATLCLIIAFPLAYFLAFIAKKARNPLLFLLIVPFWTNFLLHVYAWFYVLERNGIINSLLLSLKIIDEPIHFLNSTFATMIMMVYYYLPFMVLPIFSSLERFNFTLIEASLDLGASWNSTFRRVLLPLTKGGIIAGFFLVFIPSFGEFAIPELMGGERHAFVGTVVSQYILGEGTGSLGSAFTLVSAVCLILGALVLYPSINHLLTPRIRRG
jgi:spermidine/putrescine transport system permease protein